MINNKRLIMIKKNDKDLNYNKKVFDINNKGFNK